MSIYIGDSDISGIYVGEGKDSYVAMQGPCPDGFHIPLTAERQAVKTVMDGYNLTVGDNWRVYLCLPFAGWRKYNNASIIYQGTTAFYRSSDAQDLYIDSDYLDISSNAKAYGFSVRPFKDTPLIPTSGWTKLYGTSIEAGGIFWSSTDGLISLSSDGTTWITMADKNLGATTVYNNGDTLSETNCGKYYQWGNNYGFAWTGSVTTSSTQVDASNYGPGNYYSSSTFIKGNGDWDSSNNANLRGGVTGITKGPNVKEVYKGTTKIRPVTPTPPAEFTNWDADVESTVTAELGGDIDATITNLFGETFYLSLDDDIGGGSPLAELGWIYDTILKSGNEWYGLQIADGGDMTDVYIEPYNYQGATDAVCIVWDNDDWEDVEYLTGTVNGDGFDFQLSSLATHFSGKDTVCMFIFLM